MKMDSQRPIRYGGGLATYCNYARCNAQSSEGMLVIMAGPSWQVLASGGGDDFGDKGTRGFFLFHDNIDSTPITAKSQVVLELVNPITHWTLSK